MLLLLLLLTACCCCDCVLPPGCRRDEGFFEGKGLQVKHISDANYIDMERCALITAPSAPPAQVAPPAVPVAPVGGALGKMMRGRVKNWQVRNRCSLLFSFSHNFHMHEKRSFANPGSGHTQKENRFVRRTRKDLVLSSLILSADCRRTKKSSAIELISVRKRLLGIMHHSFLSSPPPPSGAMVCQGRLKTSI